MSFRSVQQRAVSATSILGLTGISQHVARCWNQIQYFYLMRGAAKVCWRRSPSVPLRKPKLSYKLSSENTQDRGPKLNGIPWE